MHATRSNVRTTIDADPAHASLVRRLATDLEQGGVSRVYPALRNAFEASGSRSGARVKGRPDIITRNSDGDVTVYDVLDGEPTPEDVQRVMLYMYLLPRSNHGRWRGSRPEGSVLHPDGSERRIEANEVKPVSSSESLRSCGSSSQTPPHPACRVPRNAGAAR